jgi:hypothetical protein
MIAMSEDESEDDRNEAWRRLIPIIQRLAKGAARASGCTEIEEEASP